jgi:hypothetical protein
MYGVTSQKIAVFRIAAVELQFQQTLLFLKENKLNGTDLLLRS